MLEPVQLPAAAFEGNHIIMTACIHCPDAGADQVPLLLCEASSWTLTWR